MLQGTNLQFFVVRQRCLLRHHCRLDGQTLLTEQSTANQHIMKWGQLGRSGGVHGCRLGGAKGHGVCPAAWLGWHRRADLRLLAQWNDKGQCSSHHCEMAWSDWASATRKDLDKNYKAI